MNLIVALKAEASPLIESLSLSREEESESFPLFVGDHCNLIISGVGKSRASAAVLYLRERFPQPNQAWVNLGFAGHGKLEVGKSFLANRVMDGESGEAFYPPQLIVSKIASSSLLTTLNPLAEYPEPIGYDMEASAFCLSARTATTRELIQVVKVVSDNPANPVESFDRSRAATLMKNALPYIHPFLEKLEQLASKVSPPTELLDFIEEALALKPFTQTQRHQVRKLLNQANALGLPEEDARAILESSGATREAIHELDLVLEERRLLS